LPEGFLLERILERGALRALFQPVLALDGACPRPHYVESLIRGPEGTNVETPEILFSYARRKNATAAVDRACIDAILIAARELPGETVLGLNVHASTLAQEPEFLNFLGDTALLCGISPHRLVIEIVEHAPPWDVTGFRNGLDGLRAIGARIALDDVGLGHANYMMILECRPDYFKVDRYFVAGSHADFHRRAVLASVAELARPFGARVVAEGVEAPEDLAAIRGLGIGLAQGFLFGPARTARDLAASLASSTPLETRNER
jgi:EAL domain-containing protein (putative c-di-GMP-specific phosphodiesterase class I)